MAENNEEDQAMEAFAEFIRNTMQEGVNQDLSQLSKKYIEYMEREENVNEKFEATQVRIAEALERIANCLEFAPDGPGAHAAAEHFNANTTEQSTA